MEPYKTLGKCAKVFEILTYASLVIGIFFSLYFLEIILLVALYTLIAFFTFILTAKLLRLFINVGKNIQNINDNLYIIAKKAEESDKA